MLLAFCEEDIVLVIFIFNINSIILRSFWVCFRDLFEFNSSMWTPVYARWCLSTSFASEMNLH